MMDIFAEPLLVKRILYGLSSNELCARAGKDEIPNKLGVPLYHTGIKSRSAAFTEIIYEPNDEQMRRIREVEGHLRQAELICVERNIGQNQVNTFKVRYYVTKDYARLAYMFHENFFPPSEGVEPDILVIDVPEWPERKVYVCPRQKVTFILGTDYYGEAKMASLRHAMHIMREERDGLGVHAGSKLYRFFIDGELVEKGALIFGLSGTGKTTITCNDHHLSPPEGIQILQDDINMLTREASIYGTERNFYIKTDSIMEQPGLLRAASDPGAILENVYVDEDGEVDFNNFSVSTNGRAITPRHKILHTAESIDLPRLDI
ncbi:MAG: phosphoenolpyruvate carboxykinase (ATP), partial [Dehalococcoidia bacterium]